MTAAPVRAGADWLALREPADAAARSTALVDELRPLLPPGPLVVHDLGGGTGSMARWLAPRLPGPQRWVLHDRDAELLARARSLPPPTAGDGSAVVLETRHDDITRLDPADLADADLVTASALLDMLTAAELDRLVDLWTGVPCPTLITLTVVGRVELTPADPLDLPVTVAFNAHQRRDRGDGRLLGPAASTAAALALAARGRDTSVHPSPWRLGPEQASLTAAWFDGWVGAAAEQSPRTVDATGLYARRRRAQAARGQLEVVVHHEDLLVRPTARP